jgi:transposase
MAFVVSEKTTLQGAFLDTLWTVHLSSSAAFLRVSGALDLRFRKGWSRTMAKKKKAPPRVASNRGQPGQVAKTGSRRLHSCAVGALPLVHRILERIQLDEFLQEHLRRDGPRTQLPTRTGLLLLLRNLIFSRAPVYGVGEWSDRYATDLLGMTGAQREHLNDDRLGRCLDRLFESEQHELVLAVVRRVIQEFGLRLDELHNDSTTISFFGAYSDAEEEDVQRGRATLAITYGHSKDHRPDLKQLLYVLTVTEDGGVPVYFATKSGNTTDDRTHQETWDLLRELVGSADFLYVADCKLATMDNMRYIDKQGGRFVSVLPATRKEDAQFRQRLQDHPDAAAWNWLHDIHDEQGEVEERLSIWPREVLTADGYRLWWFHSTRKAERDEAARLKKIDRAIGELNELRRRMTGPRTRFRERKDVQQAVKKVLDETGVRRWLRVGIHEWRSEQYRQATRGRPGKDTKYVKRESMSYDLEWEINAEALEQDRAGDGVFPLVTNVGGFSALDTLLAYKRQPVIEKRFSQLKTDFAVAPVYLKNVRRIQAMLCVYFFAMLVQTLLERELRNAMQAAEVESLPLYPEGRACKRPTTRRVVDVFEPIQRHTLTVGSRSETFVTELSRLQRRILKLLKVPQKNYGL